MKSEFFVDLHCHPSIKAFARSFNSTPGVQSNSPKNNSSMWYRDAPSTFDKLKNYIVGLTNFIQSDASSLIQGRVCVVFLSFYSQEKGFFINKAGKGIVSDALTMLATEFGKPRIDHLQGLKSYWEDLQIEMQFALQHNDVPFTINGKRVKYRFAESYADIDAAEQDGSLGETTILFIPTIEGCHVFDQVMDCYKPWNEAIPAAALELMLQRMRALREGQGNLLRPLFVTFAHHFWNGLCGHAKSLAGIVKCVVDQQNGMNTGFTAAGRQAVSELLKERTLEDGTVIPPVLIDIKHMSRQSRLDYFSLLETEFPGRRFPIIASHAGVTGLSAPGGVNVTKASQEGLYMTDDINMFDDELLKIGESGGLFGIQLDERRIGSKQALRNARGHIGRRNILYAWAKLVWNQARHIAELLDMNGQYAWGIQSLGTDFDGIIDPINGYWTAKELDNLDDYLLKHAYNYLNEVNSTCPLTQERNRHTTAEEVVDRIMTGNALNFLSNTYK